MIRRRTLLEVFSIQMRIIEILTEVEADGLYSYSINDRLEKKGYPIPLSTLIKYLRKLKGCGFVVMKKNKYYSTNKITIKFNE